MIQQVPPFSNDAELSVLGSMLLSQEAVCKVIDILDEDCFYQGRHKVIYTAIVSLFSRDEAIDILTVSQELRATGKIEQLGGATYLVEINNICPTAENVVSYAYILLEHYIKRKLIEESKRREISCFEETSNALEEIEKAEKSLSELMNRLESITKLQTMYTLSQASFTKMMDNADGIVFDPGIMTGFMEIDEYIHGFKSGDLVIVAARPSMGKTAFALNIARYVAQSMPIGLFSLEMTANSFYNRLLSSEASIPAIDIIRNNITAHQRSQLVGCISRLAELPIIIDDSPVLDVLSLKAKAKRMKKEHKVGMIIIDYLQLMKPPKADSREREVSIITRTLKTLAKELEIPIIALCQLNREVEKRASKTPQLSDLRESGSIEQDADIVIFLNRLEKYGIDTYPDGSYTEGTAQVIIGKNREGEQGTVKLKFEKNYTRFSDRDFLL